MKNINNLLLAFVLLAFFSACNENMPEIDCLSCATTTKEVDPDDRKVLIEEFTGVRCINCPKGAATIAELVGLYGERVIPVAIHAGFYAKPYSTSLYDFRTDSGDNILDFLKSPLGFPAAIVNRTQFDQEQALTIEEFSKWPARVVEAFDDPAIVNLAVSNAYNSSNRRITTTVEITPIQDINEDVFISIMLAESGITDVQLMPSGEKNEGYTHKHVLRDMMTNYSGDPINDSFVKGEKITLDYTYTLPDDWAPENMDIIAFAHFNQGDNKTVLQADEASLPE